MKVIRYDNENFTAIKWCLRAKAAEGNYNKLYADKDFIICTDTRRMHIIKNNLKLNNEFINGTYSVIDENENEVIIKKSEEEILDYKKVIIPENELAEIREYGMCWSDICNIIRVTDHRISLNIEYLVDILNDEENENCTHFTMLQKKLDLHSPIIFKSIDGEKTAYIMPIIAP